MKLAILAEKPRVIEAVLPFLAKYFTSQELENAFVCYPIFRWYVSQNKKYKFPKGLKWADFPFTGETSFGKMSFVDAQSHIGVPFYNGDGDAAYKQLGVCRDNKVLDEVVARNHLQSADKIISLMDCDQTGMFLAHLTLSENFDTVPWHKVMWVRFSSFAEKDLKVSFEEAKEPDNSFFDIVNNAYNKWYFDYNYWVNAFALLPEKSSGFVPSRNALQLLYSMRDNSEYTDGGLIEKMVKWPGTGKYTDEFYGIGSEASRAQIVESLVRAGLVFRTIVDKYYYVNSKGEACHSNNIGILKISDLGHQYLNSLHPSCEDEDQLYRLDSWSQLPPAEVKAKIDRYIRTFFGKQKNFLKKNS